MEACYLWMDSTALVTKRTVGQIGIAFMDILHTSFGRKILIEFVK